MLDLSPYLLQVAIPALRAVVPNAAAQEAVAMRRKECKPNYRRTVLRLPDLDHCKLAVLNSLSFASLTPGL